MSAFYASKMDKVAAAGTAHNEAMKQMYPLREDRLQALNLNIKLALVGDTAQVRACRHGTLSKVLQHLHDS